MDGFLEALDAALRSLTQALDLMPGFPGLARADDAAVGRGYAGLCPFEVIESQLFELRIKQCLAGDTGHVRRLRGAVGESDAQLFYELTGARYELQLRGHPVMRANWVARLRNAVSAVFSQTPEPPKCKVCGKPIPKRNKYTCSTVCRKVRELGEFVKENVKWLGSSSNYPSSPANIAART